MQTGRAAPLKQGRKPAWIKTLNIPALPLAFKNFFALRQFMTWRYPAHDVGASLPHTGRVAAMSGQFGHDREVMAFKNIYANTLRILYKGQDFAVGTIAKIASVRLGFASLPLIYAPTGILPRGA